MNEPSGTSTLRGLISEHKGIRVPLIQRDYAQGRRHESEIREDFLQTLKKAVGFGGEDQGEPINLDFVYGTFESPGNDGEAGKVFEPLDGQQRMTTLFLLHWYLACLDGRKEEFDKVFCQQVASHAAVLSRFTYRVRQSSREFFDHLVRYSPDFDNLLIDFRGRPSLRETILDQPWYFSRWKYDPTVQSALVMLDAIRRHFADCKGGFSRLMSEDRPVVTFNFLDLDAEEFKLTDDLYVKMNARGKLLTPFETFKARYEELLKSETKVGGYFVNKEFGEGKAKGSVQHFVSWRFDREWTDYFWKILDNQELDAISAGESEIATVLDQRIMNLLRALGAVALDPDRPDSDFDNALKALRDKEAPASYHLFDQCGCINKVFTLLLIALMETKVPSNPPCDSLKATEYFDDTSFLKGVTQNATGESLSDYALFAGYVWFLHVHGTDKPEAFREWMRVVRNLIRNSRVERRDEFRVASRILRKLVPHADDILGFLRSSEAAELTFPILATQFQEECLKAQLLGVEQANWRELIEDGESHGYLQGQVFCLLEFAGVCAAAEKNPVSKWTEKLHQQLQAEFQTYLRKLKLMFNDKGLNAVEEFRWERALLSMGDYLLFGKSNFSFLHDRQPEETRWKRLLSNTEGVLSRRQLVKSLWDKIDPDSKPSLIQKLDSIISDNKRDTTWRGLLIQHPEAIAYCQQRYIRFKEAACENSEPEVYLLSRERIYGAHTELRSYCLYLDLRDTVQPGWTVEYEDYTNHQFGSHLRLTPSNGLALACHIVWNSYENFIIRLEGASLADVQSRALKMGYQEYEGETNNYLQRTSKELNSDLVLTGLDGLLLPPSAEAAVPVN